MNLDLKEFKYIDGIFAPANDNSLEKQYPSEGSKRCYEIEDSSLWFAYRNLIILNQIKKKQRECVIDIGGGNGFVSKAIQDCGIQTILVEPSKDGVINSRTRGVKNIIYSNIEGLGGDIKTDTVGLFDVLEHLDNRDFFLEKIRKLLTKDGRLILTVPTYMFLWSSEDEDSMHKTRYTLTSLKSELEDAGFQIEFHSYFFSILVPAIFCFRRIPYLLNIRNNSEGSVFENQGKNNREHTFSIFGSTIAMFFRLEVFLIKRGFKIPFGSSLLVEARKVHSAPSPPP